MAPYFVCSPSCQHESTIAFFRASVISFYVAQNIFERLRQKSGDALGRQESYGEGSKSPKGRAVGEQARTGGIDQGDAAQFQGLGRLPPRIQDLRRPAQQEAEPASLWILRSAES